MNYLDYFQELTKPDADAFAWYLFNADIDYEIDRPRDEWDILYNQFRYLPEEDYRKEKQLARIAKLLTEVYGERNQPDDAQICFYYYDGRYHIRENDDYNALISLCSPDGNQDKSRRALIAALEVLAGE